MKEIHVIKESGEREPFDASKVKDALRRAGLGARGADGILARLLPKLHDGIRTKQIYAMVYDLLEDMKPEVSHRYNLKRALFEIGPAGHEFEDFITRLLSLEGYRTEVRQMLRGKCVNHEIDVIAAKNSEAFLVECKFYNEGGVRCRIQTALYVYARYLDLAEGARHGLCRKFTKPWLITNTKFSEDVVKYAECMEIPLLGWRHPLEYGLEAMIDRRKCYPITVIPMSQEVRGRLLSKKIVTVFDLPENAQRLADICAIPLAKAREIVEQAAYAR